MSAPLTTGTLIDLDITNVAFGGYGVARHEGFVVLVPRTAPGDRIRARVASAHRTYAEGRLERILRPSSDRAVARCGHFDICGGCAYQHVQPALQAGLKAQQVHDALERLGGLTHIPLLEPVPAPQAYAYRNRIELTALSDRDGRTCLGYHCADSPEQIFPVRECPIAHPALEELRTKVDALLRHSRIRPYDTNSARGTLRRAVLRTSTSGETLLELWTSGMNPRPLKPLVEALTTHPGLRGIVQVSDRGEHHAAGPAVSLLWGHGSLREEILGLSVKVPAACFAQTFSAMSGTLYEEALRALGEIGQETCLDLFCGVGALSMLLEQRGAREVLGVEVDASAARAASQNAHQAGSRRCRFIHGSVENVLAGLGAPVSGGRFSKVLLNPPRAGLTAQALERLLALSPERLSYVSCNPSTLARDLKHLVAGGYRLEWVRPLDLFPQTAHVETVASVSRI